MKRLEIIDYDYFVEKIIGEKPPTKVMEIERARGFVKMVRDINVEQAFVSSMISTMDRDLGRIARDIYGAYIWSLGLGWLTWVALSPFLREALAVPLTTHYREKFRTREWTRTELEELWKREVLTDEEVKEEMAKLGYKDNQITKNLESLELEVWKPLRDRLLRMALKKLQVGMITKESLMGMMKAWKFTDREIKAISLAEAEEVKAEEYERKEKEIEKEKREVRDKIVKALTELYEMKVLPTVDYSEELRLLDIEDEIIRAYEKGYEKLRDLEKKIRLAKVKITRGDIIDVLKEKKIPIEDGRKWLKKMDYDDEEIDILFKRYNIVEEEKKE